MPAASASRLDRPSRRLRVARALCSWMPPLIAQRVRDLVYPLSVGEREDLRFTVSATTGSPFTGTTSDFVAYRFAVHGYFNWRNVAIAKAVCGKGDTIFDIGANVGTETVGFSDIVGNDGAVYAFEPFPANFEQLELNAAQTRQRNVTVLPLALGDRTGQIRFAVPMSGNSGTGYVLDDGVQAPADRRMAEVAVATLDSLLPELRPPRLMVVDAEGHEAAILAGAEKLLACHRPVLVLEVLQSLLGRAGAAALELASYLRSLDYELFEIKRFRLASIDGSGEIPIASDWLAIPPHSHELISGVRRTIHRSGLLPCVRLISPLRSG